MISSHDFNDTYNIDSSLEFQAIEATSPRSLFLIVQTFDHQIKYYNPAFIEYFALQDIRVHTCTDIYNKIIHPDDLPGYLEHLESLKEIQPEEYKSIKVRMKNSNGTWSHFFFKDRLYSPEGKRHILSEVFPIEDAEKEGTISQRSLSNEYRHLLKSLDEAFCIFEMIFDEKGNPVDYLFQEINPAFEKQINLKDFTGKTIRELVPDQDERWFTTYGNVAVTGEPVRFQVKGEKILKAWLDIYAFRLGGPESRRVAVLFHNINDRKLAEEKILEAKKELEKKALERQKELEENNALLQTIFNTTTQGIAVLKPLFDENGNIKDFSFVRVNNLLLKIYPRANTSGKTFLETSSNSFNFKIFKEFKNVAKTGKGYDKEIYFHKDGYNNWFRITALSQRDLVIATIEDITERKVKDSELIDTVRFKQQLVRTSPETILILNLSELKVNYINKDIYPEEGLTREKILHMPLAEIIPYIHPRDRERIMTFHKKILKSEDDEIHDIEIRLQLKPNIWEWFSARGKVFQRNSDSRVEEYVLLVRNINKQKETQKALVNAEKFSILGEVARTLAHELRNPIASMGMATEVLSLKLRGIRRPELEKYLRVLKNSAHTLNDLVNNLLNSSNYNESVMLKQDLSKIVESTLEKASDRIYLAGIEIKKKYKGAHYILADRDKMEIALLNIIVNASEATIPGEGVIHIEIKEDEKDIILLISDNGHGLEKEQMDRLFEAFYSTKETGVGVGLNSVKNILEEHDSRIEVSSEPKKGTSFWIYFPKAT